MLRSYAGKILWVGAVISLPAVFMGGHIQRTLPKGTVEQMVSIERDCTYLSSHADSILFPFSTAQSNDKLQLFVLADASLAPNDHQGISGVMATLVHGKHAYHIAWISHKQRRVSHSSFAAEVLAVAEGDELSFHLRTTFQELGIPVEVVLATDSRTCFDCSSSDHLPRDLRTRATIKKIQDNWLGGDIDVLKWLPGKTNLSDGGTKANREMWLTLSDAFRFGVLPHLTHDSRTMRGRDWTER